VERLAHSTGLPATEIWQRISSEGAEQGDDASSAAPANFEKRKQLRAERQRLVGRLYHLTGERHRDINAHINGACGLIKIDEASDHQLERSINLLNKEIAKRAVG
jgi:acyl-CoA reductase-like NAD-dependent aldehyde dehydrogenase